MNAPKKCKCGRPLEPGYNTFCRRCCALPRDEISGFPKWQYCLNCGGVTNGGGHGHFVPPGGGDPGFFSCKPKARCRTCGGRGLVKSSTSGRENYDMPETVPCQTCGTDSGTPAGKSSEMA